MEISITKSLLILIYSFIVNLTTFSTDLL